MKATKKVMDNVENMVNVMDSDEETRKMQFDMVMANVVPNNFQNGKLISGSANVPVSCCYVDERYQGMREHKDLNKLRKNWNEIFLNPILLVPHKEEHRFAIVDGQARSIVAPEKGIDKLSATIMLTAPEDGKERLKYEAELFANQDAGTSKLRKFEKHQSRMILGDPVALHIEEVIEKYNLGISGYDIKGTCNALVSYDTLEKAVKVDKRDKSADWRSQSDFIFTILVDAKFTNDDEHFTDVHVRALKTIYEHMRKICDEEKKKEICEYLTDFYKNNTSPDILFSEAKKHYSLRKHDKMIALYLQDLIRENVGIDIYIELYKKKKMTY